MLRSVNNGWQGESGEPITALKDDEALVGDVLLSAKSVVIRMRGTLIAP